MCSAQVPVTSRWWLSCATVVATPQAASNPKPCTKPFTTLPVPWWRSIRASGSTSPAVSGRTLPPLACRVAVRWRVAA